MIVRSFLTRPLQAAMLGLLVFGVSLPAPGQTVAVSAAQRATPPILAPDPRPALHFPRVLGASPHKPVVFRVPATGQGPLTFSATDLPAGLHLDPKTGIITGQMSSAGSFTAHIAAQGPSGRAEAAFTFACARHALARTPPMGWDSFNIYAATVSDASIRQTADWLVKTGLAAHGYSTLIIDDTWEGARDKKTGRLLPNKQRFPDMAALAAYLHGKGLKLGLSSSATSHTCSGYAGSQGHELEDAALFAGWGIDYLRYDWCPLTIDKQKPPPDMIGAFVTMRQGLDEASRDLVYSVSTYARNTPWEWAAPIAGANSWGTTSAMYDAWSVLSANGFGHPALAPYAGPGHWNNPGLLMAGRTGFGSLHFSHLTLPEQMTQISLWSLQAAPLILSCDLSQLDPNAFHRTTTALLTNDEVLAVDQDPQGIAATQIVSGSGQVWSRPLSDGTLAVGLFNLAGGAASVSVPLSALGLSGPQPVRDLWLRRELGSATETLTASVPPHGVALVRIGTPGPLKPPPAPLSEPERGD